MQNLSVSYLSREIFSRKHYESANIMKAELTKRLFRAIASDDKQAVHKLLKTAIATERDNGHTRIADDLEHILNRSAYGVLSELTSESASLVNVYSGDRLRNWMVLPEAIESKFAQIEKEYAARERLQSVGLPYLQKILLYGPPGCGKSLGAERLAKNLGLPLLKVQLSQLIDSRLGETAKNIKTVFDIANKNPSVLFLDECDALMWSRSSNSGENIREMKRVVNTLLQILDEFESQDAIIVAATNLESSLDFAIWRRFEETIFMPKPNAVEVKQLLNSLLRKDCNWGEWVQKLEGYSHAEIVKVCQKARKLAFFKQSDAVEAELDEAIAQVKTYKLA